MKVRDLRALVTGGAGFIGSHLVDRLLENRKIVVCYDNFNPYYSGKEGNVKKHTGNPNYHLVRADILDFESLSQAVKDVDVVYHLAAQPGVRYSIEHPLEVTQINVCGTTNVLEAARQGKATKIVYASSSSVYGNPESMPVSEDHPLRPISPYGASKLAGEKYCQTYAKLYGMDIVMLRYFTVYGPRQRPDMAIRKFVTQILDDRPPVIYGDGTQMRDFTYIDDIVAGTIAAAETRGSAGEAFNLGGGHRTSVNSLVQRLLKLCGKVGTLQPVYEAAKLGDVENTHADIRKASHALGYNPRTELDQGLKRFIEWCGLLS